jgi:hypothetical protein
MLTTAAPVRKTAWLLLLSLSLCYLSLAPCTTDGRGYVGGDMQAGLGVLASFNAWVKGRPIPPIEWTRHGPIPLLFDLPFIKLGKLFVTPDFLLSLQPVVLTAGLLTIVYLWLTRVCTPGMSLLLTLIGAFGTMLWPYAYIGLETKQSFFVILAGYLALANGKIRSWSGLVLFALVAALAITSKSTGLILAPPIAYLVYVQFQNEWRSQWKKALTVVLIIAGIWAVGAVGWNVYWAPRGGGPKILKDLWITDSVFQLFTNAIGLFGSSEKGLFAFAPVLLLTLYAVPRAFKTHREITIFGLLVTLSFAAFLSTLVLVADEVWGPRFMHVTIAPMLIIIGAALSRLQWRTLVPLVLLGTIGFAISFLGAFYYYGARGWAATAASQNTLEWFAGDRVWNEIRFNARLFSTYLKGGKDPVPWTPSHFWAWTVPPDAPPWKTLNLRDYANPQSYLIYYWSVPLKDSDLLVFRICLVSAVLGPLLLLWVIVRTVRHSPGS